MASTNNRKKPKNRKHKIHLVFDEEKRREFLTGFHKRKVQRQKQAQKELEEQLKAERKRLKQEARDNYKKLVVSYRPIPELEHLLKDEYETEGVSVQVVELSTDEIAKQNNWIGPNAPQYESDKEVDDDDDVKEHENEIQGMDIKKKIEDKPTKKEIKQFKSKKDLKKTLKKQATKNVQKSKAFQLKNKIEKQRMIKKSKQHKAQENKLLTRGKRKKKSKRGRNND